MGEVERRAEIAARCEVATPGPWGQSRPDMDSFTENQDCPQRGMQHVAYVYRNPEQRIPVFGGRSRADAAFIAHAREDVPWLLEQLTAARAEGARRERERVRGRDMTDAMRAHIVALYHADRAAPHWSALLAAITEGE